MHIEPNRALLIVDRHEVCLQDNKAIIDSRVVYHAHRVQHEPLPVLGPFTNSFSALLPLIFASNSDSVKPCLGVGEKIFEQE